MITKLISGSLDFEGKPIGQPLAGHAFNPSHPIVSYLTEPVTVSCASMDDIRRFLRTCRYERDSRRFEKLGSWSLPSEFEQAPPAECDCFAMSTIAEGPATRTITAEFAGDAAYTGSSGTATLTCLSWTTKMVSFNRTAKITDRTELKCRLLRSDNAPLYNKTINFYVDGTFIITRPTNVDGYASYPYYTVPDGAGAGTRTILSEWPGNAGYAAISKTATLTVLKAIPYIWVLPKSVPQGSIANLYAYFRRLYDYQKQEGKTVDFKLDGTVIQTVVTGSGDQGGIARYLYHTTEPVGVHTIRCEFAGDAWVDAGFGEANLTIY